MTLIGILTLISISLIVLSINLFLGVICLNNNSQYPNHLDINKDEHDAIIICHYQWWKRFPIYGGGIEILVKGLDQNRPYCIYHCLTANEVRSVIMNPKTKRLWIFSHGSIEGSGLSDGYLEYETLNKYILYKKFHRNTECKNFDIDILNPHLLHIFLSENNPLNPLGPSKLSKQ